MTKEQKIEAAALKHSSQIYGWPEEISMRDFTAGAKFGYELAVEEFKLDKMRGDYSSSCPNHQETKGIVVTEPFEAHGVKVDCDFYKCPICDMTWLSGRQENEVDLKIKNALLAQITELEYAKQELEIELKRVGDEYQGLKSMSEFLDKQYYKQRTELEKYKTANETDSKSVCEMAKNIAGLERKVKKLEQQLKEAECVIKAIAITNNLPELKANPELAETYLAKRGER